MIFCSVFGEGVKLRHFRFLETGRNTVSSLVDLAHFLRRPLFKTDIKITRLKITGKLQLL